jgi:Protein of unknown function (DUF3574)
MSRSFKSLTLAALIAGLGACTGPTRPGPTCAPGTGAPMALFTLYMGKSIQGRSGLADREWQSFLDRTVTVALPNGYTVLDASGAWMSPATRRTVQEATKVLMVALPDTPDSLAAVNRVRRDYQTEFHQQLVGMTTEQTCALF